MDIDNDKRTLEAEVGDLETFTTNWLVMAGIFFAVAVVAVSYRPNGKWYFLIFFGIGVAALIIIAQDSKAESNELKDLGAKVPRRMDQLYYLILFAVGAGLFMMFSIATHKHV